MDYLNRLEEYLFHGGRPGVLRVNLKSAEACEEFLLSGDITERS